MHSIWKSRRGGPWVFLANSFERGTWSCEKIRGGRVLLHFYVEVFQKSLWGEVHEAPPSPSPPLCASIIIMSLKKQVALSGFQTLYQSTNSVPSNQKGRGRLIE